MDWLHNRKTSLAALGLTLAVSLLLYHFVPGDSGHLSRYGVSIPTVQTFYGAAIVVLALVAYYLFQFLPDIPASLSHYPAVTGMGTFKLPLPTLQIMLRFSLSLSPIMLGFSLLALVILL